MTAKVITVTSGKGGVGKTTTVANIAVSLALDGKKVVCIDGDIGLRNLDVVMGLENRIVYDIVDIVAAFPATFTSFFRKAFCAWLQRLAKIVFW